MGFASSFCSNPDVLGRLIIEQGCRIIESLRGIAISIQNMPKTQQGTFPIFRALLQPVLELQFSYLSEPNLSKCLLKFSADFIKGNVMFLEVNPLSIFAYAFVSFIRYFFYLL